MYHGATGSVANDWHSKIKFGSYNHILVTMPMVGTNSGISSASTVMNGTKLFVNGYEFNALTLGSNSMLGGGTDSRTAALDRLYIGGSPNWTDGNAAGRITNFSIWNTQFTSDACLELYNNGRWMDVISHMSASHLWDWFRLGEESSNSEGTVSEASPYSGSTYAGNNFGVTSIDPYGHGGHNTLTTTGGSASDFKVDFGLTYQEAQNQFFENGSSTVKAEHNVESSTIWYGYSRALAWSGSLLQYETGNWNDWNDKPHTGSNKLWDLHTEGVAGNSTTVQQLSAIGVFLSLIHI